MTDEERRVVIAAMRYTVAQEQQFAHKSENDDVVSALRGIAISEKNRANVFDTAADLVNAVHRLTLTNECERMSTVKVEFDNPLAAQCFVNWLKESGTLDYHVWMKLREEEEKTKDITATSLEYVGLIVKTVCGRIDGASE